MPGPETGFSTGPAAAGENGSGRTSRRTGRHFALAGGERFLGLLEWVPTVPDDSLLDAVEKHLAPSKNGNTSWRYEEAHVLETHSVLSEEYEGARHAVVYKCPWHQQHTPQSLLDIMRTVPCPSAQFRRQLAHIIATQVRSLHVHFAMNHPALRTESFVFFGTTTGGAFPHTELDHTKPYTLDWATATTSAQATPLTVEGMFQHPAFREMPARKRPVSPPWYNQAWALMMILTEIADWRPIYSGPFQNEAQLVEATQQRVRLVSNAAWKNAATADIMSFGFSALLSPQPTLDALDHWQVKTFYDSLCTKLDVGQR